MLQYFEKVPQVMMIGKGKHDFLAYLYANYDDFWSQKLPIRKKKEERALSLILRVLGFETQRFHLWSSLVHFILHRGCNSS